LMDTERRMASENAGMAVGGFEAELMGRELTARRDEIRHALDSFGAELTENERQQLQRELAKAENDIKKYGIDTQNSQYMAGLSQADRHFLQEMAQRGKFADQDNAFRYAQLGQDDSQFRDQMGFQHGDRASYWDAVRRGLL
jgi:CRISPR/Cas system-associated endoribonuclease Cas2